VVFGSGGGFGQGHRRISKRWTHSSKAFER
jgi:hypothetical protein